MIITWSRITLIADNRQTLFLRHTNISGKLPNVFLDHLKRPAFEIKLPKAIIVNAASHASSIVYFVSHAQWFHARLLGAICT